MNKYEEIIDLRDHIEDLRNTLNYLATDIARAMVMRALLNPEAAQLDDAYKHVCNVRSQVQARLDRILAQKQGAPDDRI